MSKSKHLILYDQYCQLCQKAVLYILLNDPKKLFYFSPLDGKQAESYCNLPKDTLVLVENFEKNPKRYIRSKGVFRIFSKLGILQKALSLFFCIPWFADLMYKQVAKKRYRFFKNGSFTFPEEYQDRFIQ